MPASAARTEANRANAKFSTGPRTTEGKQRSASNALRHGITAKQALIPTDDPQAYQEFCEEFIGDMKPLGALERQLVQNLADMQWRLNRCRSIEQSILAFEPGPAQIDSLNKFSLYEHRLSRNFQATLRQFLEVKAARKQQEERDLKDAAKVLKHLRSKQIPYNPADDGFVFSTAEVEQFMRRADHVEDACQDSMMKFNRQFFGRNAS